MQKVSVIVLAAGKGTRLKKKTPKVLRLLSRKPLIYWSLKLLANFNFDNVILVIGYGAKLVQEYVKKEGFNVTFVKQIKLLGTANAVKIALNVIPQSSKAALIIFGDDSALYRKTTLKKFISYYFKSGSPGIILVTEKYSPTSLGCLRTDKNGNAIGIYDEQEMVDLGVTRHKVVCGAFIFNKDWLKKNIKLVTKNRISGEYTLPSLISIAAKKKEFLKTFKLSNPSEWQSVNTEYDLRQLRKIVKNYLV